MTVQAGASIIVKTYRIEINSIMRHVKHGQTSQACRGLGAPLSTVFAPRLFIPMRRRGLVTVVEIMKSYPREKPVQSVERTLRILETLAEWGDPMNLSEISSHLNLTNSTTHRLLRTLIMRGFAQQDPLSGKYKLGIKTFSIGNTALYMLDIRTVARAYLHLLAKEHQETSSLAILDNWDVVYIDQVEPEKMVRSTVRLGSRAPAHCSAAGKALLAVLQEEELETFFKNCELERYTSNTIVTAGDFREELLKAGRLGFALDLEETEDGIRSVAAPVFNHDGSPVAALGVSGPSSRISLKSLKGKLAAAVVDAAQEVSILLGCKSFSRR